MGNTITCGCNRDTKGEEYTIIRKGVQIRHII